jgi:hypothetical protein
MNEVDKIKKQLREAEEKEKLNNQERKLLLAKTNYMGKCSATHTFSRMPDQFHGQANRVVGVTLDNQGNVLLECRYVDVIRYKYPYDSTIKAEVGEHKRSPNSYYHYRYDITVEQFEAIYASASADMVNLYANIQGIFKNLDEYQTMGEHGDLRGLMKNLEESGQPYIDLTDHKEFVKILSWEKCGLLVGNYVILTPFTITTIETIIKRLRNHASIWSARIAEEDHRRIRILNNIIRKIRDNENFKHIIGKD